MAGLDEISKAIGRLEATTDHIKDRVDHTHDCLHSEGGVVKRLLALEHDRSRRMGFMAGVSASCGLIASLVTVGGKYLLVAVGVIR